MKIYSYSKCATCRKAIAWLKDHNFKFDLISILESPPSKDLLFSASIQLGDRKLLFNTSGISYRKLGAKFIKGLSDDEAFEAMVSDPKLIKRPFLFDEEKGFLVGFKEPKWDSILLH